MIYEQKILRELVKRRFLWEDLSANFAGVDSNTGNIFCPFHDNKHSPAAKMYYREDEDIWSIHCFNEHRDFTTYDYVDLVLVRKNGEYCSVEDFLIKTLGEQEFKIAYREEKDLFSEDDETAYMQKLEYIDNTFMDCDENIEDYFERLYAEQTLKRKEENDDN